MRNKSNNYYQPGVATTTRRTFSPSTKKAIALLAGGLIGACSQQSIHSSRPLRAQGISNPLYDAGNGNIIADASAVDPSPGDDASVVWIFLHTGQSLSVGLRQDPTPRTPATASAPGHYMLDGQQDGSGALGSYPWSLTTLANPCRSLGVANAGIYPTNIWDEVPMVAMGARLTSIEPSVVSLHEVYGINGAPIYNIGPDDAGGNGSFAGIAHSLKEMARLIRALGKEPRVAAIVHTHGESDNGNADYKNQVGTYRSQIEALARAATGQTDIIPMFLTQASARWPAAVGASNTTWQDMVDLSQQQPERFVLVGPKYQLSYDATDFHLDVPGYRDLGYLYADAWVEWRKFRTYKGLAPLSYVRTSSTIEIKYDLSPGDALTVDTSLWASNHSAVWPEWANGKGFEVLDSGSNVVTIDSVSVSGDTVTINAVGSWPAGTMYVSYANYSDTATDTRRGQIRSTLGKWAAHSYKEIP